jgi:DNA helicase-2/ATP-dependent DNA helicase PcrA
MDEERRLAYVGITRAKKRLYLVHAYKRGLWGGSEIQRPSRFLDEIPADLLSGMVDHRARRAAAYQRETAWDVDDDQPRRSRREASDEWLGRQRGRQERSETKSTYWSPGGDNKAVSRPQARPAKAKPNPKLQYKRRDSVQHATFGVGTVIESNLVGGEEEVMVAFPGVGIKRLLVSMAGLRKL